MTDREDFELKISREYEQPSCLVRDGEGYDDSYVDNAWWGWQAARATDAKRIAELEDLLDEQRVAIRGLNMCIGGEDSLTTNNLRRCGNYLDDEKCLFDVIAELEAQNKAMREVLSDITTQGNFQMNDDKSQLYVEVSKSSIKKVFKVLAKVKC